jgi:hypothetical protein
MKRKSGKRGSRFEGMVVWKLRRKESKQQVKTKEKTNRWKVKKGMQAGKRKIKKEGMQCGGKLNIKKEGMQAADLKTAHVDRMKAGSTCRLE